MKSVISGCEDALSVIVQATSMYNTKFSMKWGMHAQHSKSPEGTAWVVFYWLKEWTDRSSDKVMELELSTKKLKLSILHARDCWHFVSKDPENASITRYMYLLHWILAHCSFLAFFHKVKLAIAHFIEDTMFFGTYFLLSVPSWSLLMNCRRFCAWEVLSFSLLVGRSTSMAFLSLLLSVHSPNQKETNEKFSSLALKQICW